MKKIMMLLSGIILLSVNAIGQSSLTSTEIEHWPKKGSVDLEDDFIRVSSYLYVLNHDEYLSLFEGKTYSKTERKALKIKKHDKPNFLQMSVSVTHPSLASGQPLTVPLFMVNFKDQTQRSSFTNYNGKLLDNIKATEIGSDVMGEIMVKALISNSVSKFWRDVAIITADVAKSASSLAMGNPAGITELTKSLSTHLEKGIADLNKLSNGNRVEDHSFFIKLYSLQDSPEFDEIVTSVRLHQIHWDNQDSILNTNLFDGISINSGSKPNAFFQLANRSSLPLVLVVETRSRTSIDLGNPVFTEDYKLSIAQEYNDYAPSEWQYFQDYFSNFSLAFDASQQIKLYGNSLNQLQPDISALINSIDLTYQFKRNFRLLEAKYRSDAYDEATRARLVSLIGRYNLVNRQLDQLFSPTTSNVRISQANDLLKSLGSSLGSTASISDLTNEVNRLDIYEQFVRSMPVSSLTNDSYNKYKELRSIYERALFDKIKVQAPNADASAKVSFYTTLIKKYQFCQYCVDQSQSMIQSVRKETEANLVQQYTSLRTSEDRRFNDCRKKLEVALPAIQIAVDSIADTFDRGRASTQLVQLSDGINLWKTAVSHDIASAKASQLSAWLFEVTAANEKVNTGYSSLLNFQVIPEQAACLSIQ